MTSLRSRGCKRQHSPCSVPSQHPLASLSSFACSPRRAHASHSSGEGRHQIPFFLSVATTTVGPTISVMTDPPRISFRLAASPGPIVATTSRSPENLFMFPPKPLSCVLLLPALSISWTLMRSSPGHLPLAAGSLNANPRICAAWPGPPTQQASLVDVS